MKWEFDSSNCLLLLGEVTLPSYSLANFVPYSFFFFLISPFNIESELNDFVLESYSFVLVALRNCCLLVSFYVVCT